MPLQGGSSAVYWEQAGLEGEEEELAGGSHVHPALSRKRKGEHAGGGSVVPADPTASTSTSGTFRAPSTKSAWGRSAAASINKDAPEMDNADDNEDEEEFTFNPDQELQDYQADGHAYEAAGQYERIEFGE